MSKTLSYFVLMVMVWLYQSACICHLCMKMALSVSPPQTVGDRCVYVTIWLSVYVYVTLSALVQDCEG